MKDKTIKTSCWGVEDESTSLVDKKDANPKYICYCNHVTEEDIINAVVSHGAKDMKDIIRLTGAMKNAQCETKNPLGKCCGPIIEEIIEKALDL